MIGMILLAVLAVLIFFGVTDRYFSHMGVANWVAFLIVLAFAVAAMFPPLTTATGVSFSYAGFFLPLLLGTVTLFALGANASLLRAVVGGMAVAGIVIATRVAVVPVASYSAAIPALLIAGFAGGIVSFVIGQSRLAALSSLLCGCVLGDFICAMLFRFVTESTYWLQLGQNGMFDTVVLGTIVGGLTAEIAAVAHRALSRRRSDDYMPVNAAVAQTEAAEDTAVDAANANLTEEDDDLYDDYFNDDID